MDKNKLEELVADFAFEEKGRRKFACADAFKLAEKYNVKLLDIARVCNQLDIKICRCQLGCFK